jgi:hypothetical protein
MLAVAGDYYLSNRLCLVPDFDVKTVWPLESMTQSLPSP